MDATREATRYFPATSSKRCSMVARVLGQEARR